MDEDEGGTTKRKEATQGEMDSKKIERNDTTWIEIDARSDEAKNWWKELEEGRGWFAQ